MEQLVRAIKFGHTQAAVAILDITPELMDMTYQKDRRPLHYAAWYGNVDIITLLLDRGSQSLMIPDANGSLPIHFAAQSGSIPCIEAIINRIHGVNILDLLMMEGDNQ